MKTMHPDREPPKIARVVPVPQPGHPQAADPLLSFLGHPVVAHLRYGKVTRGVLKTLGKYELVLQTASGAEIVVMKHAVDWIEPGGTAYPSLDGAKGG